MKTITIAEALLFGSASKEKDHPAIIQASADGEKQVSYGQFYSLVDRFETFYLSKGIKNGDRILMVSPNTINLAASIIAAWRLSALAIPVDFRMTAPEAANVAARVEVSLLLVSKYFNELDKLPELLREANAKAELVRLDECCSGGEQTTGGGRGIPEKLDFSALMILTSGTTGIPKGAVHDLESLLANLKELGQVANLDPETVALLPLPVSHIFGLEVLSSCLIYGATIVFCELEPTKFVTAINTYKPHILAGVPMMYGSLLSAPSGAVDLSRARVLLSGGAPLPLSLAQEFEKKYGNRINNGYGSTESKIIALNLDGPVESIGRPIPSVKVRIVNDQGEELPEGSEGEIIIDSPHLMQGYLGQEEKSKEVLSDKGYKTGDIGYVKDGYIFISGRAKEMIVVAGNKVFPSEVEEVLMRHSLVKEVAVTGPEHRRLGQIVKATIVVKDEELSKQLKSEAEETRKGAREAVLKQLKDYCQENLKRELRPMEWDLRPISEPLPKTRSGKIDKKVL